MGEMMDDAFEAMEEDGVDEEADEEVDKVLYEITKGLHCNYLHACKTVNMLILLYSQSCLYSCMHLYVRINMRINGCFAGQLGSLPAVGTHEAAEV